MKAIFLQKNRLNDENSRNVKQTLTLFLLLVLCLKGGITPGQTVITLDECKKKAVEHNQKIQIAAKQTEAADDLKKAAFTQFLPNFSINGAYTYISKDLQLLSSDKYLPVIPYTALGTDGKFNPAVLQDATIAPTVIAFDPSTGKPLYDASGNPVFKQYAWLPASATTLDLNNIFLIKAGFVQPIFMGGKVLETYKMAKITKDIAKSSEGVETSGVLYNTVVYYWTAVSVKEKVKLALTYQDLLKRLYDDVSNYYKEGVAMKSDLLKVETKLGDAELQVLKAQNGERLAVMALCQIIGESLDTPLEPADSLGTDKVLQQTDSLTSQALQNRKELAMLSSGVDMAHHNVKLMQSRFMPNIALTANSSWINPNPFSGFTKEFGNDLNVGVVCNIPLFHWGEKVHTMRAAKVEEESAQLKLDEARELVSLEVKQAQFNWEEAMKKAEVSRRSLEQANENLNYSTDRYHEGMLKLSDLLEAQTLFQQAWSEHIDAMTDLRINETKLLKVSGQLNQ